MVTSRRGGFTVPEILITCALFVVMSSVLFSALQGVSRIWYRTSSRDDAIAQILKAKASLTRDLVNSSQQPGQFDSAPVGPNLGSGYDGDALSFLSSDDGSGGATWTAGPNGQALIQSQISYFLIIPNTPNGQGFTSAAGAPDSANYEQQNPCKWLVRRVDTPAPASNPQALLANWKSVFATQPTAPLAANPPPLVGAISAQQKLVADQIFQFRVSKSGGVWNLQLSSVAIRDAVRQVAVGTIPLEGTTFNVVEQCSVPSNN